MSAVGAIIAAGAQTAASVGATVAGVERRRAARREAREVRRQAAQVIESGQERVDLQRQRAARLLGSQRAAFGAAGLEFAGSPLIVQAATLIDEARNDARILAGAREQAASLLRRARNVESAGLTAFRSAVFQSGGQLFGFFGSGALRDLGTGGLQSLGQGEAASIGSAPGTSLTVGSIGP